MFFASRYNWILCLLLVCHQDLQRGQSGLNESNLMRLNSSLPNVRSRREGPERCLTLSVATATLLYTNNSESTNSIYFAVCVCALVVHIQPF